MTHLFFLYRHKGFIREKVLIHRETIREKV